MSLKDSYTDADTAIAVYGTFWSAQTFTASSDYDIASVALKLYRSSTPGTITVSIRAVDGSGHPTGSDLASGTTDGDTLTELATGEERTITFGTPYSLVSGTQYAIVVRVSGAGFLAWFADSTSPSYAGGNEEDSADSGANWASSTGFDLWFRTYDASAGYVELAGSVDGASTLTGDIAVITFIDIAGAMTGTSGLVGFMSPPSVVLTPYASHKRLLCAGNNQIWYEDID